MNASGLVSVERKRQWKTKDIHIVHSLWLILESLLSGKPTVCNGLVGFLCTSDSPLHSVLLAGFSSLTWNRLLGAVMRILSRLLSRTIVLTTIESQCLLLLLMRL
jgi:hypothetical protein